MSQLTSIIAAANAAQPVAPVAPVAPAAQPAVAQPVAQQAVAQPAMPDYRQFMAPKQGEHQLKLGGNIVVSNAGTLILKIITLTGRRIPKGLTAKVICDAIREAGDFMAVAKECGIADPVGLINMIATQNTQKEMEEFEWIPPVLPEKQPAVQQAQPVAGVDYSAIMSHMTAQPQQQQPVVPVQQQPVQQTVPVQQQLVQPSETVKGDNLPY